MLELAELLLMPSSRPLFLTVLTVFLPPLPPLLLPPYAMLAALACSLPASPGVPPSPPSLPSTSVLAMEGRGLGARQLATGLPSLPIRPILPSHGGKEGGATLDHKITFSAVLTASPMPAAHYTLFTGTLATLSTTLLVELIPGKAKI